MSSILIQGMEMPVTCCHCPLMGYYPDREWYDSMARTGAHICVLTGELIDNTKREEHCPLVPIPPHGRLIDADELHKGIEWIGWFAEEDRYLAEHLTEDAPTVIEEDGEPE